MTERVEIIPIARRKIERRGIKDEWIEDAVLHPLQVVMGYGGRKVAHKKFIVDGKEYLLRVVYEKTKGVFTVITAYLTSQVTRYWKEGI